MDYHDEFTQAKMSQFVKQDNCGLNGVLGRSLWAAAARWAATAKRQLMFGSTQSKWAQSWRAATKDYDKEFGCLSVVQNISKWRATHGVVVTAAEMAAMLEVFPLFVVTKPELICIVCCLSVKRKILRQRIFCFFWWCFFQWFWWFRSTKQSQSSASPTFNNPYSITPSSS